MKSILALVLCVLCVSACSQNYATNFFKPTFSSKSAAERAEAMRAYAKWYREHYEGTKEENRRGLMTPPPAQKIKLPVISSDI